MSEISIINVFDALKHETYTINQYFPTEDKAAAAVAGVAAYYAQQNQYNYTGFDAKEGGYIVKSSSDEIVRIFSIQTLYSFEKDLEVDRIV